MYSRLARLAYFVENLAPSGPGEFLLVSLCFLLILVILFWRVVFLQEVLTPADLIYMHDPVWRGAAPPGFTYPSNPLLSDQVFQFYPWLVFGSDSLRHGIVPLWNPFVLGGTPFLANQQSAVFYPLNLLLTFLPMPVGIGYLAIIRLLIAGLSSYYYIRTIGVSRTGAFIGSCAFAFGGFCIVWLGSPISNAAVLLPLLLLLTERLLRYGGNLHFAALALVVGAQFLGGHPETSFHVSVTWTAYLLFRVVLMSLSGSRRSLVFKRLVSASASFLIGFLIASIQVLPFLAILSETSTFVSRRGGPGGDLLFFPGVWKDLILSTTILFPNLLGNPIVPNGALWNPFANYNEQAAYTGTVPFILAIVGATRWRKNPLVALWVTVALIAAGIAYHLPGFELVNHIPPFSIAANGRLRMTVTLAAAVLCAFGVDLLIQQMDDKQFVLKLRRWTGLSTVLGAFMVLAAFASLIIFRDMFLDYGKEYVSNNVYGQPGYPQPLDYYLAKLPAMYDNLVQYYNPLALRVSLPVIFAVSFWVVLSALYHNRIDKTLLKASLVLLAVVELGVLAYGYNPSMREKEVYPTTKAIAFLREGVGESRIAGIGFALTPNASMLWHLRDVRGYEMTVDQRFQSFYGSLVTRVPFGAFNLIAKPSPKLFDLLGVKYIVAQTGDADSQSAFPIAFESDGVSIYDNVNALPRVLMVGQGQPMSDDQAMLEITRSTNFNLRGMVLLESSAPAYEPTVVNWNAEVRDLNVNEIEMNTSSDAPAWLVLNDTYDNGWRAYIDGEETRIYRANYVMRAVRVDAGKHAVRFSYDPMAFEIGWRISIAALLLTGMIALYPLIRRCWAMKPLPSKLTNDNRN